MLVFRENGKDKRLGRKGRHLHRRAGPAAVTGSSACIWEAAEYANCASSTSMGESSSTESSKGLPQRSWQS